MEWASDRGWLRWPFPQRSLRPLHPQGHLELPPWPHQPQQLGPPLPVLRPANPWTDASSTCPKSHSPKRSVTALSFDTSSKSFWKLVIFVVSSLYVSLVVLIIFLNSNIRIYSVSSTTFSFWSTFLYQESSKLGRLNY